MPLLLLGNVNPAGLDEPSITRVVPPEGATPREIARAVVDLWRKAHTPGGPEEFDLPEWIECDDAETLGRVISAFRDVCDDLEVPYIPIATERPEGWRSIGDEWTLENGAGTAQEA